jgi:hypothetical protein
VSLCLLCLCVSVSLRLHVSLSTQRQTLGCFQLKLFIDAKEGLYALGFPHFSKRKAHRSHHVENLTWEGRGEEGGLIGPVIDRPRPRIPAEDHPLCKYCTVQVCTARHSIYPCLYHPLPFFCCFCICTTTTSVGCSSGTRTW